MWPSPTVEHINNDCCKAYQVANDNITSAFTTLFHELILQIDLLNSILSWWTFFNSLNETFQLEEMTVVVVDGGVHRQAHFFARHRVSPPPCEWQRLQDRDSLYNYWSQRQRQSAQLLIKTTKKDWLHNNRSPPPQVLQRPPIARKLPFTLADARRSKVRCGEKEFEDGKCRVAFSWAKMQN